MAHFHSPRIVTDELVLALDAANTKSYPGSGTTWSDLSGNGNNGTLTNGPTFDSDNLGGIVFDGVNDSVLINYIPLNYTPLDSFSMNVWAMVNFIPGDNTFSRNTSVFGRGSTGGSLGIGMQKSTNNTYIWLIGTRAVSSIQLSKAYTLGNIEYATLVYTPTFQHIYVNSQLIGTQNTSAGTGGSFDQQNYAMGINRAVPGGNGAFMEGEVFSASIYNRALTATEVLQNYNATKGRFGL